MRYKVFFMTLVFFLTYSAAMCQKHFTVTIQIASNLKPNDISISYHSGKEMIIVKSNFKNDQITLSGDYYSKYSSIYISYPKENHDGFYTNIFWVSEKNAKIKFKTNGFTKTNLVYKNPLENVELINAYEVRRMGGDQLKSFAIKEQKDFDSINHVFNTTVITQEDSLSRKLFAEKLKKLDDKKIEFVKQNPNQYYSFWYFRNNLLNIGAITGNYYKGATPDSLLKIYNTTFPDSLKNTFEGEQIVKRLKGRALKKGKEAPNFTTTDVDGKSVTLSNYRNKHVLLVFWASWCPPCIEEAPAIKRIRESYPEDKLEIIAFTLDRDMDKFNEAVKKYDMNYIHIFRNEDLLNTFGIIGIPEVMLVDPNGIVQYKSQKDEKLPNKDLLYLNELLKERLSNL